MVWGLKLHAVPALRGGPLFNVKFAGLFRTLRLFGGSCLQSRDLEFEALNPKP